MSFRPAPDAEPIPGYRLIERLGAGGYGEVWKVSAPGGILKAFKFIYGQLDDSRAGQEVKSLNRIRGVRHPFLLTIERVEIIDGQLAILTELADETLTTRFEQYRNKGEAGIPRDLLLSYMRDVAGALDYMSEKYSLQHLDIKPGNLLLVADRLKVADFGLVKELHGDDVTATGGVSPAYAACEFFDGRISRYSDQYSLAIVYMEMLTGCRPFPGTTAVQLALQHSTGKPMLDPLPAGDRTVVARALSKDPNERYPSCRHFVDALSAASPGQTTSIDMDKLAPEIGVIDPPTQVEGEPSVVSAAEVDGVTAHLKTSAPALLGLASVDTEKQEANEIFPVRPTVFIGLGGMGIATIERLRLRLAEGFGTCAALPMIRTLVIDSDKHELRGATERNDAGRVFPEDVVTISLQKPEHYRNQSRDMLRWMDRRWFFALPKSQQTEGLRPLGRLALLDHADKVKAAVREAIESVMSTERDSVGTIPRLVSMPHVVLLSSICGGTGSGAFVDMVHLVRSVMHDMRVPTQGLSAVLLHATSPKPAQKEIARANAYATLLELNHLLHPNGSYAGEPLLELEPRHPQGEMLRDCYVVHLGDDLDQEDAQSATDLVAEYLMLQTATGWRKFLDDHREESRGPAPLDHEEAYVRSLGLYRLRFRRLDLARHVTQVCCRHLVSRWHGDMAAVITVDDEEQTQFSESHRSRWLKELGEVEGAKLFARLNLKETAIIEQIDLGTKTLTDSDPVTLCESILQTALAKLSTNATSGETLLALIREFDLQIGPGEIETDANPAVRSTFEKKLIEKARKGAEPNCQVIVDWVRHSVGNAQWRIKPAMVATDLLVTQLLTRVETAQRAFMDATRERQRLRAKLTADSVASDKTWLTRAPSMEDVVQQARTYFQLRFCEITRESVFESFRLLYRTTTEIRARLLDLRQRCSQWVNRFERQTDDQSGLVDDGRNVNGVDLLPGRAASLAEASAVITRRFATTSFFADLEDRLEAELFSGRGGLWNLATNASADLDQTIAQLLPEVVMGAVMESFDALDSASLFFEKQAGMTDALREIKKMLELARPKLADVGGKPRLLLGVPNSPQGRSFRELVMAQLPKATSPVGILGDILFCYESARLPIARVAEEIIGHEAAFVQVGSRLLTRTDQPIPALHGSVSVPRG